jgi:hypothetical protein
MSVICENGDTYIGEWKDGKKHCDKGRYIRMSDNSIYDGPFVDDQMTGKATITYHNAIYEGDVVNGQYHGQGKHTIYADNKMMRILSCVKEGMFKHNKLHGEGKKTLYNHGNIASEWIGTFVNDQLNGECKLSY